MSRFRQLGSRLYTGEVSINFVGGRKLWYAISAVLLLISIGSMAIRGLHLGIEFEGGATFTVPTDTMSVSDARGVVGGIVTSEVRVTELTSSGQRTIRVETPPISPEESSQIRDALATEADVAPTEVSVQQIGPTWGEQITDRAVFALVVFIGLIVLFLSVTYEWRMALAAIIALFHDVIITVGAYSVLGFLVTPASVIGVLTILGYSLYDTVVVYDKVRENTRGLLGTSRSTYSEAANLAVNQTVVRSMNTSLTTLIPIAAILFIGSLTLHAGVLKELALALFVGIMAGTYSSVFLAPPILAQLKEREPQYRQLARRVGARKGAGRAPARGTAKAAAAANAEGGEGEKAAEATEPATVGATPRPPRQRPPQRSGSKPRSKRRPSGKKRR